MRRTAFCLSILALALSGCSSLTSKSKPTIYAAGDKATIGPLVYSVTDTVVTQQLGDDPNSARTAQNRFYLVKVSISNSSTEDQPVPAMSLVDDDGQNYSELADGTSVPGWLGVVRKVSPSQTEQGNVIFDAPNRHYRVRLTDPLDEKEVAIDMPLDFVRDQLKSLQPTPSELPKKQTVKWP